MRGVGNAAFLLALASHADAVSPARGGENRFHLNAKHAAVLFDDHVVRFAVAVGLADGESHAGGFDDEDQFRDEAFALGIQCRVSDRLSLAERIGRSNRIFCHKRLHAPAFAQSHTSPFLFGFELENSRTRAPATYKTADKTK